MRKLESVLPLQKTLRIGTHCTDDLRRRLLPNVATVRIAQRFTDQGFATSFADTRRTMMDRLFAEGRRSGRQSRSQLSTSLGRSVNPPTNV